MFGILGDRQKRIGMFKAVLLAMLVFWMLSVVPVSASSQITVTHQHSGDRETGGGCYTGAVYHAHSGDGVNGGGCYSVPECHVHSGNHVSGGGCFTQPVCHVHEGSDVSGGGCYETPVYHVHSSNEMVGGGCYNAAVYHEHSGSETEGEGCYTEPVYHTHSGSDGTGDGCYTVPVYHGHQGSSASGGGCYTEPVYHTHSGSSAAGGGCYTSAVYHQHSGSQSSSANGCYTKAEERSGTRYCGQFVDDGDGLWTCNNCGERTWDWNIPYDQSHSPVWYETVYVLGCGKTTNTAEYYQLNCGKTVDTLEYYDLGCGKTISTVEKYDLGCEKDSSTVERYELGCGKTAATVEKYALDCGKTVETVEKYDLSCGKTAATVEKYDLTCGKNEESVEGYSLGCNKNEQTIEYYELQCEGKELVQEEGETGVKSDGSEALAESETPEKDGAEKEQDSMRQPVKVGLKDSAHAQEALDGETGQVREDDSVEEGSSEAGAGDMLVAGMVNSQDGRAEQKGMSSWGKMILAAGSVTALLAVCLYLLWKNVAVLYCYDRDRRYRMLGIVAVHKKQEKYRVQIDRRIWSRATVNRYRLAISRRLQKKAEDLPLLIETESQNLVLPLEEFVDFAL